jgi:hypothetical protein
MTYKIFKGGATVAKNFNSIDDARDFLGRWGELIAFDLDAEGHDAADAALVRKTGALEIYAIERED